MRLVSSASGVAAFGATASLPSGTNATPGTPTLETVRRFYVDDVLTNGSGAVGFRLVDALGHTLALHLDSVGETLKPGSSFEIGGFTTLDYEEDGPGRAFRSWSAEGGSVVVDDITEDMVSLHIADAKMVAGTEEHGGGDFPVVKDSAKGDFTLSIRTTLPLAQGKIAFDDGGKTSFDGQTINPTSGAFSAYSSAREIDLHASLNETEALRGRSIQVQLFSITGSVSVGDTFVLNGRQGAGIAVDYGTDGSHIWWLTSGTATVRAIRGRVVTVDISGATFEPKERASGTIVANGTR